MTLRLRIAAAAACAALSAAACEGTNAFAGSQFGVLDGPGTTTRGSIVGSVLTDAVATSGVTVVLVGRDSTVTDGSGAFAFDSLTAATYQVTVRVPTGSALAAGQTATRSVTVTGGTSTGVTFLLTRTTTTP